MPLLRIEIDGEYLEFKIIPINTKIRFYLLEKYTHDGLIDRPGFMAHVVREPKMSRKDWGKLPSSTLTKVMRVITAYCDSIVYRQKEIRDYKMYIRILEEEIDEMFEYTDYNSDDWVWDTIKKKQKRLEWFEDTLKQREMSLKYLKEDKVLFEEDKEVDYDVQSI